MSEANEHDTVVMCDFEKCISRKVSGNNYKISCKLGLWSVESINQEECEKEAYYYWQLYARDGEYHQIIGGCDPITMLMLNT